MKYLWKEWSLVSNEGIRILDEFISQGIKYNKKELMNRSGLSCRS